MTQRHQDALLIAEGASNPIGIANAIVRACREITDQPGKGTQDVRKDPAVRLMVHQLAYLVGVPTDESLSDYESWLRDCEAAKNMSAHEVLAAEARSQDEKKS